MRGIQKRALILEVGQIQKVWGQTLLTQILYD